MKKLTKQQRLEAYVYCYLRLGIDGNYAVCLLLLEWLDKRYHSQYFGLWMLPDMFLEFKEQEPKNHGLCWWHTLAPRLRAIETCISLCEQSKD